MAKKRLPVSEEICLLHAEMFQGRHLAPCFVQNYIYPYKKEGYNPMATDIFKSASYERFSRWKAEGINGVVVYRSGLLPAWDAILNAAWLTQMYVRPMLFSFLQGVWMPNYLACFDHTGFPNSCTKIELEYWKQEYYHQERFKDIEDYKNYVRHCKAYSDCIALKFRDPQNFDIYKQNRFNMLKGTRAKDYVKEEVLAVAEEDNTFYERFRELWLQGELRGSRSSTSSSSRDIYIPPVRSKRGWEY